MNGEKERTMGYGNGGACAGAIAGGNVPTAYTSAPDQPVRMPMIALEMDRQAKTVEHLHILISTLSERLSAVLRPDAPAPSGGNEKMGSPCVPLAGGLSDQNTRIEGACIRLQSIFDRMEL